MYDLDRDGHIHGDEIKQVLNAMLDLLDANSKYKDINKIAKECLEKLDASKGGRVSKGNFINFNFGTKIM